MINDLWYKNAVIYCLSVGTYMDSNGDGVGVGDFKGLFAPSRLPAWSRHHGHLVDAVPGLSPSR